MKKTIITVSFFCFLTLSCENKDSGNADRKPGKVEQAILSAEKSQQETSEVDKLSRLKKEASRLRAGGSVKSVELSGKSAKIVYVENYEEYKKLNPQSSITEADLEQYWETGNAIEKALVDGPVRIMAKLEFIDTATVILPYKGNVFGISVNKSDLVNFVGADFKTIQDDWDKSFSDKFVYADLGRKIFLKRFGLKE